VEMEGGCKGGGNRGGWRWKEVEIGDVREVGGWVVLGWGYWFCRRRVGGAGKIGGGLVEGWDYGVERMLGMEGKGCGLVDGLVL